MATIALYSIWANQMPIRVQETRLAVVEYQDILFSLNSQALTIDSRICNMDDVIGFTQESMQKQEEKVSSLDVMDKNNEEFILDVIGIDDQVRDRITQRKDDFYARYNYLKPECEKDFWEKAKDWFVSAGEFCRENWKGIVLIIGSIVFIIIMVAAPPAAVPVVLTLMETFLYCQLAGGILSAAFTAFKGGSLEEIYRSYIDGAFSGALYSLLFSGMGITAAGSVRFGDLAIRTLMKNGFFAGLLSQALGDAGDKFIKGDDISYGQIAVNSIWAGMIDAAFTGIVYGASRAFRTLWQRFRGVGGAVEGGRDTVTYRRVQGGSGNNASQARIHVNEDGTIHISNKHANLSISIDNGEHAQYFLNKRGGDAYIIEIEVPKWFDDFLQENAIPQFNYSNNPLNQGGAAPKITDITTPGNCFELPAPWIEWLEEIGNNARIVNP